MSGSGTPSTPSPPVPTESPAEPPPEEPASTEAADGGGTIVFSEDGVQIDGTGASLVADSVRISTGGSYRVTGGNGHATVSVFAPGKSVQIILDGATLYNGNGPALSFDSAAAAELVVSGAESTIDSRAADEGALRSEAPLTITGDSTVLVTNAAGSAILVRNDLNIAGGHLLLTAPVDGIQGSGGSITISGGNVYVNAKTNGISSKRDIILAGGATFAFSGDQNNGSGLLAGGSVTVTGGTVVSTGAFVKKAAGSQPAVIFQYPEQPGGTTFTLNSSEAAVTTVEAPTDSKTMLYSAPELEPGALYALLAEGTVVSEAAAGSG